MGKLLIFFMAILASIFIILLSASVSASGYNFFVYNPASIERQALAEIPKPNITFVSAYPEKVMPGQVLLVAASVEDASGIKKAVAIFDNEKQADEINMLLISGTKNKGVWEARWIVHDTFAQKWYNITITATNIFGKTTSIIIPYQDPTQSHNASEIVGGTFTGNYTFAGGDVNVNRNLNVTDRINASAFSIGATAGWSGVFYINESIDSYTKLLLHADGSNGSTTFTDSATAKAVTANGQAHTDTQYQKFGTASARFDGTGDYLSIPDHADWAFGTGDFTIDTWVRTAQTTETILAGTSNAGGNGEFSVHFGLNRITANKITAEISFTGTSWGIQIESTTSINNNVWHHIALVRNGSNFNLYIDGTSEASATSASSIYDASTIWAIGRTGLYDGVYYNGWIDEFRISKGIARWTSNFDVRTSAYGGDKTITINKGIITGFG